MDKTVDWTAEALETSRDREPAESAGVKLWSEDEKVKAFRDRTREMVENALEDEEKMQRVRLPRFDRPADPNVFLRPDREVGSARRARSKVRGRARRESRANVPSTRACRATIPGIQLSHLAPTRVAIARAVEQPRPLLRWR